MYITVSQLADCINNCKRIESKKIKHYKVYFEISGKEYPVMWFCHALDYNAAKQAAHNFLTEELSKGFYKSGFILSIKEI